MRRRAVRPAHLLDPALGLGGQLLERALGRVERLGYVNVNVHVHMREAELRPAGAYLSAAVIRGLERIKLAWDVKRPDPRQVERRQAATAY